MAADLGIGTNPTGDREAARLEFRILGEVALRRDGVALDVGGRRPRALLAVLLVQRGRPVLLETIIDRLWPDDPPDSAAKTIHVYISRLRALLGEDRARIASRKGGYELMVETHELDGAAFEEDVTRGRELLAAGSTDAALARLDRAFQRWRGRPFGDLADEPFLRAETQRLEDVETEAQELRAATLVAAGRAGDAIGPLRQLVADQPARESTWSQLMLALFAAGRQADALDAFHRVRAYLDDELGIEPGAELQAAHLAVLQQSAAAPPRVDGSRRRGGTSSPERTTDIMGRDRDIEAVEGLLDDGVRLVTLIGPGGVGKTTLCRELLARAGPAIDGPVVLVELEAVRGPDLVPAAVAAALGGDGDAADQIGETDALIGLDNLEHILGAAPWVGELLRSCPRLRILATSREPLRIEAERIHPVGPLDRDASRDLFLARARRVRPDLPASPAIDAVCARLDRLPLAIELAAARTSLLSPDSLLARLERALDVLAESPRDRADRQRTLRSTIAWSYELLEPDLRRVFRGLAVFVGGFGIEAAEAIAGATLEDLDKLLSGSLITARYDADEPRFHLLETIRAFALERLAADDGIGTIGDSLEATRRAHAAWAADLVARAGRATRGDEAWSRVLARELDNLREAMSRATSVGDDITRWRIATGLSDVWQTRGHLAEARAWLEPGLDGANIPDDLRAEALDDASTMAFRQGQLDDARRLAERQLELAKRLDQPRRMVAALAKLAEIALRSGDPDGARALHAEAFSIAGRDTDPRPLMVSLSSQANADLLAGRADLAAAAFDQCLRIAHQVAARPESVATAYFNVGLARLIEGRDLPAARDALREALARYGAMEDREGVGYVLVATASLLAVSDPAAAARALGASAAALASVDATLEAVEADLREKTENRLLEALGSDELAVEMGAGAARPQAGWIEMASAGLGAPDDSRAANGSG